MASEIAGNWTHELPRNGATRSRLSFTRGLAPHVTLRGADLDHAMLRARFAGPEPDVHGNGEDVLIEFESGFRSFPDWPPRPATVELARGIPWSLSVQRGVTRAVFDLAALDVRGVSLAGGASDVEVTLPEPSERVRIRFSGGASDVVVRVPPRVRASLHVAGAAARTQFRDQFVGAMAGGLRLGDSEWGADEAGYEVRADCSVSGLRVVEGREP